MRSAIVEIMANRHLPRVGRDTRGADFSLLVINVFRMRIGLIAPRHPAHLTGIFGVVRLLATLTDRPAVLNLTKHATR